jgi:uncharacterized protein YlzI (FlbEa/FlbD family)
MFHRRPFNFSRPESISLAVNIPSPKEVKMIPWLQSIFNFPLSGDINQEIDPDWFFYAIDSEVGDSEIEKEIFSKVASYGKQIGMLTEVLLSVADELKLNDKNIKTLSKLRELQDRVDAIKTSKKKRVKENAKAILDKLQACDQEAFDSLMEDYRKQS